MMRTRIPPRHGLRHVLTLAPVAMLASLAVTFSSPAPTPPPAPVRNVTNSYFGVEIADPYRWMEDWNSAEFRSWLKAESDLARATLDQLPARKELLTELRRLDEGLNLFPSALNPVGRKFFYMQTPPPTDVFQLFVREGKDGRERMIFDPRMFSSPDGSHASLDLYHAAPDGEHVVCRVSRGGSEGITLPVVGSIDRVIRDPREPGIILPLASWTEATAYHSFDPKVGKFSKLTMGMTATQGIVPLR